MCGRGPLFTHYASPLLLPFPIAPHRLQFEEHAEELRGKDILMCCTGGVRCVRTSALLKERGFGRVFHLSGGMQRYMVRGTDSLRAVSLTRPVGDASPHLSAA